ncbi:MAG TPA: 16S rRNA (uracil(1498)-N(3))-methyltransferase [Actinobacteria bacterium]|nr:16S rRNA (uracil(1498)-N(3))-methyltransferase [Actinomycetota bacterium]
MSRFFVGSESIDVDQAHIHGSDVHHIRDVLRLKAGDKLTLIDESATEFACEISEIHSDHITARIVSSHQPLKAVPYLALFQGIPKGRKLDLVVEKATELGVDRITPVLCERSVPRPDSSSDSRLRRWRRIAQSAAKQCRRASIPEITGPMGWPELTEELRDFDRVVVFWEAATEPVDSALADFEGRRLAILIGPEGGLAASEVDSLMALGAKPAWLGPRILRTETAPIVALAIVNFILKR